MAIKAVIFDLDGTITTPYIDFNRIREDMGLDQNAGPIWEAMSQMTPQRRKQCEQILDHHEQTAVEKSTLNSGAKQTLTQLRQTGIDIGVLTRNKRTNAIAVAKKHNLKFDAVVGREDGPVKPDPFGVLHLCTHFAVDPAQTLVVGDYLFDLLSAKAAGATAVLLATNSEAENFKHHADFTIEQIDELFSIIEAKALKS